MPIDSSSHPFDDGRELDLDDLDRAGTGASVAPAVADKAIGTFGDDDDLDKAGKGAESLPVDDAGTKSFGLEGDEGDDLLGTKSFGADALDAPDDVVDDGVDDPFDAKLGIDQAIDDPFHGDHDFAAKHAAVADVDTDVHDKSDIDLDDF